MATPQTPGEWFAFAVGIASVLILGILPVIRFFYLDRQSSTARERNR